MCSISSSRVTRSASVRYDARNDFASRVSARTPPALSRSKLSSDRSLTGTSEPMAFFQAFIVEFFVKPVTNLRNLGSALGGT